VAGEEDYVVGERTGEEDPREDRRVRRGKGWARAGRGWGRMGCAAKANVTNFLHISYRGEQVMGHQLVTSRRRGFVDICAMAARRPYAI
jgi:hypothetical protein